MARAIGLEGRLTATVPGETLTGILATILEKLGSYPHAALVAAGGSVPVPKPGDPTRTITGAPSRNKSMQKVVCEESGYLVRISSKWLLEGTPSCPCHNVPMVVVP